MTAITITVTVALLVVVSNIVLSCQMVCHKNYKNGTNAPINHDDYGHE
jgi:hypothetical protein